jgi:hypothetical protein
MTTEPQPQSVEEQQKILLAQHANDVNAIIDIGRQHFGSAVFDEASQAVGEALGEGRVQEFMAIARQFDRPHELVIHLAGNEKQLKGLAKLSPARMTVELARIEAQMSSHGHVNTGADPAWKNPSTRSGRVSDEDWAASYGEGLSEKQFDKEFWRRQEARAKRRF